jgi:hypothetical protein
MISWLHRYGKFLSVIAGRAAPWLVAGAFLPAIAPAAAEEELGRLFFTPERREALDRQRQSGVPEHVEISAEEPVLRIEGVVTRSNGNYTIWINGSARNDAPSGITAPLPEGDDPGWVLVRPKGSPAIRVGVGDTVNQNTGETAGILGDGRIRIQSLQRR